MKNGMIFLVGISFLVSTLYGSECSQKESMIQSLEQSLVSKDRAYREAVEHNKRLVSQNHAAKVSQEERKMLQRALLQTKEELAKTQKALKNAGVTKTIYKDKPVVQEKIVEKIVYRDNPTANQIASAGVAKPVEKIVYKDKIVEKIVYRDNPSVVKSVEPKIIYKDKIVEKIVYRDNPSVAKSVEPKIVYKDKIVEKIVYKDKIIYRDKVVASEPCEPKIVYKDKIVEKIVYKEKPASTKVVEPKVVYKDKIVEKVVYKERPASQEKTVEKAVDKDKPIEKTKVAAKTTLKAPAIVSKTAPVKISQNDQNQRQIDKLALERERQLSALKTPIAVKLDTVVKKGSPSAYRFASNAGVYNGINGTKIDMWEQGRSFTSGTSSSGWVKITGYFVNRVWQPAEEEMWVKESDVIRR
jgi:hypothetical protein